MIVIGVFNFLNAKYAFLGAGNIANAIISGLAGRNLVVKSNIFLYDTDAEKYKSKVFDGLNCCDTMKQAVDAADFVVFALKPSVIPVAIKEIRESCPGFAQKTYISVAAAVSSKFICDCFGVNVPVIRTMPNTPLLVGEGAIAISRNAFVSDESYAGICSNFTMIAETAFIDEEDMDGVISVNGSSPAYVYLFYKAMLEGAAAQGIGPEKASPLILKSIKGAVKMLEVTGKDADTLIREVSSPGGTTLAALAELEKHGFAEAIAAAMTACTKRAKEMAMELEKVN